MLHTFENYSFGTSEFDTPIEDPKLDGRFVERIQGSDRESSIGVFKKAGTRSVPDPYNGHAVWGTWSKHDTAIERIIAPLERPTPLEKTTRWGIMLTKTEQV